MNDFLHQTYRLFLHYLTVLVPIWIAVGVLYAIVAQLGYGSPIIRGIFIGLGLIVTFLVDRHYTRNGVNIK